MKSKRLLSKTSPNVILVTGGTGAGKTTYARKLCDEIGAIRFSIDDWMTGLFWMDAPSDGEIPMFDWAMERIGRAEKLIRQTAEESLKRGVSVVLDLGFTKAEHRRAFARWANSLGHSCELHWVDVPPDMRWERVQNRNREQDETFAMTVPREMFDFMESEWEDPVIGHADDKLVITRV